MGNAAQGSFVVSDRFSGAGCGWSGRAKLVTR